MKYKLLKDLPWIKSGAILQKDAEGICINECQQMDWVFLDPKDYPDWFEPVIQEQEYALDYYMSRTTCFVGKDNLVLLGFENCFRTKAQAEEASNRIKKCLMDYHKELGE